MQIRGSCGYSTYIFLLLIEYVNRYATKEAADAATDDSGSEDDMSSVGSFSDEDAPGLEL